MRIILTLFFLLFLSCTPSVKEVTKDNICSEVADELEIVEGLSTSTKSYDELKSEVLAKRTSFKKRYDKVEGNTLKQDSILQEAQKYLVETSDEFFQAWYGTPWDFNGHTTVPREGQIACGYLVTTILKDMGFNIPRIKWAQQASAYIVQQLSTDIRQFRNQSMEAVVKHIEEKGEGLYIVGLDTHVGFIYYHNKKMSFVHANYYRREVGVMSEQLIGWNPLSHSKYRIIGKIFTKEMTQNWLLKNAYPN